MLIFDATLRALAPLFFLMLLGAALRRTGLLKTEHIPILNSLVVNVTLPALVIRSLTSAPSVPASTLWLPLAVIVAELVTLGLAYAAGRVLKFPRPQIGALMLCAAYGNTGFLGYPITLALFPHQFTAAVLLDQIGMSIPMYVGSPLVGAALGGPHPSAADAAPRRTAADFFRSPIFLSMVIGGLLRLIPWPDAVTHNAGGREVGGILDHCLLYLGQGTVPLILLSMGAALRPSSFKRNGAKGGMLMPIILASVLKMIALPLVMLMVLRLAGVHGSMLTVGVMLGAMPTAVMSSVLAREYGMDADYAVGVVFVTTVLTAVALPIWVTLIR